MRISTLHLECFNKESSENNSVSFCDVSHCAEWICRQGYLATWSLNQVLYFKAVVAGGCCCSNLTHYNMQIMVIADVFCQIKWKSDGFSYTLHIHKLYSKDNTYNFALTLHSPKIQTRIQLFSKFWFSSS